MKNFGAAILLLPCVMILVSAIPQGDSPYEPYGEVLKNAGQDCWNGCNYKQGKCSWCGLDGYCCRKGWTPGNGCDGSFGGDNIHACVLNPTTLPFGCQKKYSMPSFNQ